MGGAWTGGLGDTAELGGHRRRPPGLGRCRPACRRPWQTPAPLADRPHQGLRAAAAALRVLRAGTRMRPAGSVLQANYTFLFVDKLRTASETLLRASGVFQSGGNSRLLGQLQVSGALRCPRAGSAGRARLRRGARLCARRGRFPS